MELLRLRKIADRIKVLSLRWKLILGGGVVAVLVIVIFSWIASFKIHDLEDVVDSGRLIVVTDSSSIGFAVNKDSVYGFQYEIIKAFADSLGVELEISEQNDVHKSIEN